MWDWALSVVCGVLLGFPCICFIAESHTVILFYHRERENMSLSSQLSVLVVFRNIQEGLLLLFIISICAVPEGPHS